MIAVPPDTRNASGIIFLVAPGPDSWLAGTLVARGHQVVHHADSAAAVQSAVDEDADLLIVSADLPVDAALAFCRTMRDRGDGDRAIVIESTLTLPDKARTTLMEAGAWECIARDDPHHAEQILRLEACLRFRRATARERLGTLTDPRTGLYNRLGLSRRAREVGAQIFRSHDPVACVVFMLTLDPDTEAAMAYCARTVYDEGRDSDIVARLGDREIAILAPGTDAEGAVRLAERMARVLKGNSLPAGPGGVRVEMRAAFDAISSVGFVPIRPIDLVIRAALTLRDHAHEVAGQWIRRSGGHVRPPALPS